MTMTQSFFVRFACLALSVAVLSTPARVQAADEPATVTLKATDQMKYSMTAFTVKSGQKVSVTLENVGKFPKVAMGHNLVVLKQGVDLAAFAAAGIPHAKTEYLAPDKIGDILAHTKLLGPGETDTVEFTAPGPGKYEFMCSFPGHALAGMKGVMTVE